MPADARAEILAALRRIERQAAGDHADTGPAAAEARAFETPPAPAATDALMASFSRAAIAAGTRVTQAAGPGAGRLAVMAALQQASARRVVVWDDVDLVVPGLLDAVRMVGIDIVHFEPGTTAARGLLQEAKPVPVALTAGLAGLADCGTVILRYGDARPAAVPAWAPQLFVLLPAASLFASAAAWIGQQRQNGGLASLMQEDLSLLTGPGRGDDIELTPVGSLYGPLLLQVFLISEDKLP